MFGIKQDLRVTKFDERGKVAWFYEKSQQEGVSCWLFV